MTANNNNNGVLASAGTPRRSRYEEAAVKHAERGYYPFPCRERGKEPLTVHGFKNATRDERQILTWWDPVADGEHRDFVTPSGVAALDIDSKHGADPREVIPELGLDDHPAIWTGEAPEPCAKYPNSLTGVRGAAVLFRGAIATGNKLTIPGCEIRGAGAYVVVPPSVHPSGVEYLGELPPVGEIPDDIERLAALVRAGASNGDAPHAEQLPPIIGENRNVTLTSAAGTMRRRGMTEREILAGLLVMNRDRCLPPLEETEVRSIAGSVANYRPESAGRAGRGRLVFGHEVKLTKPEWLIPGRIPLQGITLVSGDPGQGKSSYTCLIAAGVARGAWDAPPAGVVFASAEDLFSGRIVQRAIAAGADPSRIASFDIVDEHGGRNMELPEDVTELATVAAEIGARLVIVDPLNAHLSTALDSFKDHGIRKALAPLARMADEQELAVVVVCHLNKDKSGQPLYRTGGSIGYVGAARSVLGFGPDPEDEDEGPMRLLEHVKSNWSELAPTEQYRMEAASVMVDDDVHDTNRLVYVGEVDRDAGAAFGKRATEDRGGDAEEAICDLLADGPVKSRDVKTKIVGELACSASTVDRAAKQLVKQEVITIEQDGRSTVWRLTSHVNPVPPVTYDVSRKDGNPVVEPDPLFTSHVKGDGDVNRYDRCLCKTWTARMPDNTCQECGGAKL